MRLLHGAAGASVIELLHAVVVTVGDDVCAVIQRGAAWPAVCNLATDSSADGYRRPSEVPAGLATHAGELDPVLYLLSPARRHHRGEAFSLQLLQPRTMFVIIVVLTQFAVAATDSQRTQFRSN